MKSGTNFSSPCETFNKLGKFEFSSEWDGTEAAAIRLGRRSIVNPAAHKRGRVIRSKLLGMIENGQISTIFYLGGDRVPYGLVRTKQITDVFPLPTPDPDSGSIELDHRDICSARFDISVVPKARSAPISRKGPKKRFANAQNAIVAYFRQFGTAQTNAEVSCAIRANLPANEPWPKPTRERELINEARELVRNEPIAIGNSETIATGAL